MKLLYIDPVAATGYGTKTYPHYSELLVALRTAGHDVTLECDLDASPVGYDARILGLGVFALRKGFSTLLPRATGKCKTVAYLYKAHEFLSQKLAFCIRNKVDLIITPLPAAQEYENKTGIRCVLFPYAVDPKVYHPQPEAQKVHDVGFTGALHGSHKYVGMMTHDDVRAKAIAAVEAMPGVRTFIKACDGPSQDKFLPREEYAEKLATTRVWLAANSPHEDIPSRHFQVMAAGAILLCETPADAYHDILRDGENCIYFRSDASDVADKVRWLLDHPTESSAIAECAAMEALGRHTWAHRVTELLEYLK